MRGKKKDILSQKAEQDNAPLLLLHEGVMAVREEIGREHTILERCVVHHELRQQRLQKSTI